jgi:hypothetical protein
LERFAAMSHIIVAQVMEVVLLLFNGYSLEAWTYGTAWEKKRCNKKISY